MNAEPSLEVLQRRKVDLDRAMEINRKIIETANLELASLKRDKKILIGQIDKLKAAPRLPESDNANRNEQ